VADTEENPKDEISQAERLEMTKTSEEGFFGGMQIDLDRLIDGRRIGDTLKEHGLKTLRFELKNQKERIDKIAVWEEQYAGKFEETDFPFEGAAAISPPFTMININTVAVRIYDALWSKKTFWTITAMEPGFEEIAPEIERQMNWFQKHVLHLKDKLQNPIMQALQTGTGAAKLVYERKVRTTYRNASLKELDDPNVMKYPVYNSKNKAVKNIEEIYNGPNIYELPREDLCVSSDATEFENAYLAAFRFRLRKPQVMTRVKKGYYLEEPARRVTGIVKEDETKERRAGSQYMKSEKTDYEKPIEFWETYLSYDVDGDGEEDEIVLTLNEQKGELVRAIYHPLFSGFRPFMKITPLPVPFRFDGRGLCEALESIQNEIDYFHSQRINRLIEINAPMILIRAGCGLEKLELSPGATFVTEFNINETLKEILFSDVFPSTEREEDRLIAMAQQVCGVTPNVMGMSTAERPVAKETFALIQEANRMFAWMTDNVRKPGIELAYQFLEMFAQYQPVYTYFDDDGNGAFVERTVNFPLQDIRRGLKIDLTVSSEVINKEIRREVNLAIYQLVSDYMTKMATMIQAVVDSKAPSDIKRVIYEANRISVNVLTMILRDYDVPDPENLVLDLEKVTDKETLIQNSPDLKPQPKQAPAQPQAQPGMEMPPGEPQGAMPPPGGMEQ
jgi:hypothetical protein